MKTGTVSLSALSSVALVLWSGAVGGQTAGTELPPAPGPLPGEAEPACVGEALPAEPQMEPRRDDAGWFGSDWRGHILPHYRLAGYYDDNIFIQHKNPRWDYVGILSAGLRVGWGDVPNPLSILRTGRGVPLLFEPAHAEPHSFFLADYTGSRVMFMHTPSQDSFDHDAVVQGAWTDGKLTLGGAVRFVAATASEIDVGNRVRREVLSQTVTARYDITGKSVLEIDLGHANTTYHGYSPVQQWTGEAWWDWRGLPKTTFGLGLAFGTLDISNNPGQAYERPLFRARWQVGEKLALNGRIGVDFRQIDDGGGDHANLVYLVGMEYAPFDGTAVETNTYRDVSGSELLAGECSTHTGVALTIRQRLCRVVHLTLTTGYELIQYHEPAGDSPRDDRFFFAKLGAAFDITRYGNLLLFYGYQADHSSVVDSSFSDNQFGFEMNLTF